MNNLHIENSYKIWSINKMFEMIWDAVYSATNLLTITPQSYLNRTYKSMYIEWWLHNIGYYVTKPFCFIKPIYKINLRCKDVDLNEWR